MLEVLQPEPAQQEPRNATEQPMQGSDDGSCGWDGEDAMLPCLEML